MSIRDHIQTEIARSEVNCEINLLWEIRREESLVEKLLMAWIYLPWLYNCYMLDHKYIQHKLYRFENRTSTFYFITS